MGMMDDKRTLIAFLLVGLIFLLMPYYYEMIGISQAGPEPEPVTEAPESPEEPGVPSVGVEPETGPRQGPAVPRGTTQVASRPEPMGPERRVVVETPLQRFVFRTAGGVVESVELQTYQRAAGGPVALVAPGGRGLGLTLEPEAGRGEILDLRSVHFEPDRESLRVDEDGEGTLRLRAQLSGGRAVVKTVRFRGDRYGAEVSVSLSGFADDTIARLWWERGVDLAERDPELDLRVMKAMAYINESRSEVQVDEGEADSLAERGDVRWAGVRNKYFFVALSPQTQARHRVRLWGWSLEDPPFRAYEFSLATRWGDVEAGEWGLLLYAGPLDLEELTQYEREFARAMDLGYPVVRQIAKVLLHLFVAAYQVIPNYGWVIVVFGVVVKVLVYPLTHKSYESAARMQELQPKIAALREKYKNNNQKLSQETMKLYREEGVNPLGGCLPLVFQMPIFIALYQVFSNAIQLRQTPWILWVEDLSLPDEIALGGFELHVLPLLMATAMFFQSKMTMKDPKQAALVYVMPVVMVFIMWRFSSGLVLYWTVFNVLQIGQQHLTNHLKAKRQAARPAGVPARNTPRG